MAIINENRMFGDIFKELRLEKSPNQDEAISQEKIADDLNVSQGLISKWESHQSTPSPEMLDYIADYFNVSTDFLIGRTSMKNNPMDGLNEMQQYKILFDKDDKLTEDQKMFFMNFLEEKHKAVDDILDK